MASSTDRREKHRSSRRGTVAQIAVPAALLLVCVAGVAVVVTQWGASEPSATSGENLAEHDAPARRSGADVPARAASGSSPPEKQPTAAIVARTISRLPQTLAELQAAHRDALDHTCAEIAIGLPVVATVFSASSAGSGGLSARRPVFSVGLDVAEEHRGALPKLSGDKILSYLHQNYFSLQVRVIRTGETGAEYLHSRPTACLAPYGPAHDTGAVAQEPTEGMKDALSNYRSLGLFLREGQPAKAEHLRTLVMLHKSEPGGDAKQADANYEYVFMVARPHPREPERLQLHALVTDQQRTVLHHLQASELPAEVAACGIVSQLRFTKFKWGGLYPSESETTGCVYHAQATHTVEALEDYASTQGWSEDPWSRVDELLDAVISKQVAPETVP